MAVHEPRDALAEQVGEPGVDILECGTAACGLELLLVLENLPEPVVLLLPRHDDRGAVAADRRGTNPKLHVAEGSESYVPASWYDATDIARTSLDPRALEINGLSSLALFEDMPPEYLGETWKLIFDITTAVNNNQNAYAYTGFAVQLPNDENFVVQEFSYRICKKMENYETALVFQVNIRDFREGVDTPAGKALIMLMRTR